MLWYLDGVVAQGNPVQQLRGTGGTYCTERRAVWVGYGGSPTGIASVLWYLDGVVAQGNPVQQLRGTGGTYCTERRAVWVGYGGSPTGIAPVLWYLDGVVAQGNPVQQLRGQGEPIALSVGPYGSGMVDPQQGLPQCCGILTA